MEFQEQEVKCPNCDTICQPKSVKANKKETVFKFRCQSCQYEWQDTYQNKFEEVP